MSWRGSEEGTYWIRLKSPSCPISKHRQQQMLGSVSHAQTQRKVLTNMQENAWLPRSVEGKKPTTTQTSKKPTCCPEELPPSQAPSPACICKQAQYQEHQVSAHVSPQPTAVLDHRWWVCLRTKTCLDSPFSPRLQMGEERVLAPICPLIGNHVHQGTVNGLTSLGTEGLSAVCK